MKLPHPQKTKIAYITHFAKIPSRNADSVCVMKTCHALAKLGYEVDLIIPKDQGEDEKFTNLNIWDFYNIEQNFTITWRTHTIFYKFGFIGRLLYKLLAVFLAVQKKSDVIYVRHLENAVISTLFGKQTIFAYHDASFLEKKKWFRWLIKISKKRPIKFLTVSTAGVNSFINWGISPSKTLSAPNGNDFQIYLDQDEIQKTKMAYNLPLAKRIIGFSGNLFPGRGIEEVIEAAKNFPDMLFLIIGGEPVDIDRCKEVAYNLNVHNVNFLGFVNQSTVPKLLSISNILLMPYTTQTKTFKDMSPMKMFDYLAIGIPMVATDFPVLREVLTDKLNAVLVKPDSSDELTAGIKWLLENPEKAKSIGERARKDSQLYTWDKRAEKISDWISEGF